MRENEYDITEGEGQRNTTNLHLGLLLEEWCLDEDGKTDETTSLVGGRCVWKTEHGCWELILMEGMGKMIMANGPGNGCSN